jgi:hypothetical protein
MGGHERARAGQHGGRRTEVRAPPGQQHCVHTGEMAPLHARRGSPAILVLLQGSHALVALPRIRTRHHSTTGASRFKWTASCAPRSTATPTSRSSSWGHPTSLLAAPLSMSPALQVAGGLPCLRAPRRGDTATLSRTRPHDGPLHPPLIVRSQIVSAASCPLSPPHATSPHRQARLNHLTACPALSYVQGRDPPPPLSP